MSKAVDYLGNYDVFSDGTICSVKKMREIRGHTDKGGYTMMYLKDNIKEYKHRIVAKCHVPNPENLPYVNHIDGDKSNNRASNLEWCTHQNNIKHAMRTGLLRQEVCPHCGSKQFVKNK